MQVVSLRSDPTSFDDFQEKFKKVVIWLVCTLLRRMLDGLRVTFDAQVNEVLKA